ncbi:MAG TPA: hypothetical protein VIK47_01665 [Kiloniellales bacterium]
MAGALAVLHLPPQPAELRRMKGIIRADFAGRTAAAVAVAMTVGLASVAAGPAAACQSVDDMARNFLSLYPTGGHVARFDGRRGDRMMQALAARTDPDEVVFLYSGDGPVTGARGRYMYLLLDPADCILGHDWIDGETFDRVTAPE